MVSWLKNRLEEFILEELRQPCRVSGCAVETCSPSRQYSSQCVHHLPRPMNKVIRTGRFVHVEAQGKRIKTCIVMMETAEAELRECFVGC